MRHNKIVKVRIDEGKKMPVKYPVGVEITMLINGETAGTSYLTESITKLKPGLTLKPAHSHKDIEEIIYVLEGEGEVWIEGETCQIGRGDSVLFPANSRHTVRNTGTVALVLLCLFSSPQYRKEGAYLTHENCGF